MDDSSETDLSPSSLDSFHSCPDHFDNWSSPSTSYTPLTEGHLAAASFQTEDLPLFPLSLSSKTDGQVTSSSSQSKEHTAFPPSQTEEFYSSFLFQTEGRPILPSLRIEGPLDQVESQASSMESTDESICDPSDDYYSATFVNRTCLCEALKQVLHNGCMAKSEMAASGKDQFQTLFDHLDFVRTSLDSLQQDYHTANVYECPQHGILPEQVVQSKCEYCIDSKTVSLSDLLDGEASPVKVGAVEGLGAAAVDVRGASGDITPQNDVDGLMTQFGADEKDYAGSVWRSSVDEVTPLQDGTTCTIGGLVQDSPGTLGGQTEDAQNDNGEPTAGTKGTSWGLSPEEKEKRKILNKASKKLLKVNQKVKPFVAEMAREGKAVQDKLEEVETNRLEVEKALSDHVKYLHSLLDYYHREQQELLRQWHKDFLHQLMVNKMEGLNFEARLTDVQKQVEDTLQRIFKDRDITAAKSDNIAALCDAYHRCVSSRPAKKQTTLTYLVEIPQVTADEIQALLGHFLFTDNPQNTGSAPSNPITHWAGSEDSPAGNTSSSKDTSSASASQHAATSKKTGGADSVKPPPPKTAAGKSTNGPGAKGKPTPSSQNSAKEQNGKDGPIPSSQNSGKGQKVQDAPMPPSQNSGKGQKVQDAPMPSSQNSGKGQKVKDAPMPSSQNSAKGQKVQDAPMPSSQNSAKGQKVQDAPMPSSQNSAKGQKVKDAPVPSSENSAKGQKVQDAPKPAAPETQTASTPSSAQPTEFSASLGSKQKQSDTMASCSSIASSASTSKAKKRARSRKRQKAKKAEAKKAAESVKPVMITLQHEKCQPQKIEGRMKEAKGFAARPNGELWVVYGVRDPHLDRINEQGKLLESCRVGGNAMHAASFSDEHVLLSLHSPFCQLKLLDAQKESRETIKLPMTPTGLGVGSTGIAVCSYKAVYWIPLDGDKNEWIVKQKGSTLVNACSCDVIILHGREIVCVADNDGHKVWFFEKLDNGEFAALPLFTYASHTQQGKTVPFSPICVSALAGTSFIAVLDAASRSVLMVDVEKNEVVSVIADKHLCDGVPSLITFALTEPGEDPKLWVASDSAYIYLVSLAFLY